MTTTNDRELLHRWAAQADEAAFRLLVERYAGLVHGVARRRTGGQQALAQEIGQNVFTMLARKAAGLRDHPSLASWLHRAAVLESAHQLRRESAHTRRLARLAELTLSSDMPSIPDGADASAEPAPELDEALARLSDTDRALLMQRFFEDLSYREIAESSGKNEAAVRKQLERALARLAPHLSLSRRGTATTAAATGVAATGLTAAESLRAGEFLHAAMTCPAPSGFAAGVGSAALAAAPALTFWQILFHSLKLMTYGKSLTLTGAALALLLTFSGGYSAARHFSGGGAGPDSGSGPSAAFPEADGRNPPGRGQGTVRPLQGNPGDSPARARLRARLTAISRCVKVDLLGRSISFQSGEGASMGAAMKAIGDFRREDLDEAWKLLPDFRSRPQDFAALAGFLTAVRVGRDSPKEVLDALLAADFRIDGKAPEFAVFSATGSWFAKDPAAAWDWMRQAVGKGDFPSGRRHSAGAEYGW